jgi:hypothetical protein
MYLNYEYGFCICASGYEHCISILHTTKLVVALVLQYTRKVSHASPATFLLMVSSPLLSKSNMEHSMTLEGPLSAIHHTSQDLPT